ncbi:MAG: hypothetical protein KIT72_04265 [Polyangiaceae bacterium]|nr:hypothetical protein [Polyangiaceae bacterium]MCW5789617.1 hypothetical protein [Polyangiaceae bacterium]
MSPVVDPPRRPSWVRWALGGLVALMALTLVGLRYRAHRAARGEVSLPDESETLSQLPWLSEASRHCARYDQATTALERQRAIEAHDGLLASLRLVDVTAELESKRVSSDGGQIQFTLAVGHAKFKPSLRTPILAGTSEFLLLGQLASGSCVRFTARAVTPASILERSKVCDTDFFTEFEALEACPQ